MEGKLKFENNKYCFVDNNNNRTVKENKITEELKKECKENEGKEIIVEYDLKDKKHIINVRKKGEIVENKMKTNQNKNQIKKEKLPNKISENLIQPDNPSAPYNFISINKEIIKSPGNYTFEKFEDLSGKIKCTIETKTPLFIGDEKSNNNEVFFFDINGKPAIPATTIKGLLRTITEIISFGKLNEQNVDVMKCLAYRDVAKINESNYKIYLDLLGSNMKKKYKGKAGILKKEGSKYYIAPCEFTEKKRIYLKEEFNKLKSKLEEEYSPRFNISEKNNLYFYEETKNENGKPNPKKSFKLSIEKIKNSKKCKLLITGPGQGNEKKQNSKKDYIFYDFENDKNKWLEIPKEVIRNFKLQKTDFQIKNFNSIKNINSKDIELVPEQPVFYIGEKGQVNFFGRCKMFRILYKHPIKKFIPNVHFDENYIDFAECIFGYAKENNNTKAGKVFISNGILKNEPKFAGSFETILSSPKPTSYQLYLEQDPKCNNKKNLRTYNTDEKNIYIRGTKMYWHINKVVKPDEDEKENKNEKIITTMGNVLDKGNIFEFEIDFINLCKEELGCLLFALKLFDENSCHKIGMGKSYGLGSVKIKIDDFYLINRIKRYNSLLDENNKICLGLELNNKNIDDYITDFKKYIFNEYKKKNPDKKISNYDNIERIKQLKIMTDYNLANKDLEKKVYMKLEQFAEKEILPKPENYL